MGPINNQTYKPLHSKPLNKKQHIRWDKIFANDATYKEWQGFKSKNIWVAHTAHLKIKQPNQKMGGWSK